MFFSISHYIDEYKNKSFYKTIVHNKYSEFIIKELSNSYNDKNLLIDKNNELIIEYIKFLNIFLVLVSILFFYYILFFFP